MRAWLLPALLLIAGCGGGRAVHEARLQPRRHQPGWQIDLKGRRQTGAEASAAIRTGRPEHLDRLAARSPYAPPRVRLQHPPAMPSPAKRSFPAVNEAPGAAAVPAAPVASAPDGPRARAQEEHYTTAEKPWNSLAVPAFIAALGAVAAGFGTSLWLLAGLVVLTLVLAAWSIARIRRRDQGGKGFAMAALVIGVLAALLTAISVARYGLEL
ncbi:MAG: DUF4190 domain-containing protein [Flavobacteriales bacterium]